MRLAALLPSDSPSLSRYKSDVDAGAGGLRTVRVNITVTAGAEGGAKDYQLSLEGGQSLPRLCVRLGTAQAGFHWANHTDVRSVDAPHETELLAAVDNQEKPEDLPLAPWP